MELMGRSVREDIASKEDTHFLAEVCEASTLGRVFADDQDSDKPILAKGEMVTVIAVCPITRMGFHYDTIHVVIDARGRVGWLWEKETKPL